MERLQAWGAQLIAVFRDTLAGLITYLPVLLTAAAVLLIGWLLAHLFRTLVRRALESMDWLVARRTRVRNRCASSQPIKSTAAAVSSTGR